MKARRFSAKDLREFKWPVKWLSNLIPSRKTLSQLLSCADSQIFDLGLIASQRTTDINSKRRCVDLTATRFKQLTYKNISDHIWEFELVTRFVVKLRHHLHIPYVPNGAAPKF